MLLHRRQQMLRVYSPGGSTFQHQMASWPPSWKCDVKLKIRLCRQCIFTWRTFLPNFIPIWFETMQPSAFFEEVTQTRTTRRRTRWLAIWDQFPDLKITTKILQCHTVRRGCHQAAYSRTHASAPARPPVWTCCDVSVWHLKSVEVCSCQPLDQVL